MAAEAAAAGPLDGTLEGAAEDMAWGRAAAEAARERRVRNCILRVVGCGCVCGGVGDLVR